MPPGPKVFASGDKVKAELDMEVVSSVLEGGGGSDGMMDSMLEVICNRSIHNLKGIHKNSGSTY